MQECRQSNEVSTETGLFFFSINIYMDILNPDIALNFEFCGLTDF